LETIRSRRARYSPIHAPIDPAGRVVIVVDDGLATGATMISALQGLMAVHPAELVCAVPVAPPETLEKVAALADTVVCLESPANFQAVGQFYRHFPQVDDEEVAALLRCD
jgi:predicted phosphoribosyltransferase